MILKELLMIYGGFFDLDKQKRRLKEISLLMSQDTFWKRLDYKDILKEEKKLKELLDKVDYLKKEIVAAEELLDSSLDDEMISLLEDSLKTISSEVDKLYINVYLSQEYDKNNCLLEIHSGAGGTESCDWVAMLYRMYTRYLDKSDYKYEEIDKQYGEEVGLKSVMIKIMGNNAYGYFKGEKGVHRLVRISPFDAGKRRHTTFASVEVIPEFIDDIKLEIDPQDLKIDIFRSSGPGGQGVNTTDSAVRVTHIPTGLIVSCQNERSQIQNKQTAISILKNKLYNLKVESKNCELEKIKGKQISIGFGNAKRSYVMCPYTLVKDNISGYESANVSSILDGEIDEMLEKNIRR